MKRVLVLFAILLVCGAMLFAEGQGESSEADAEPIVLMRSHGRNPYAMQVTSDDVYFQKMSELSGVNVVFEFVDHGNYNQVLTLRFASGEFPDAAITSILNPNLGGALEGGVFKDITDAVEEFGPNIKKELPEAFFQSPHISVDGRLYGLPWTGPLPDTRVVYMRKDWLDRLGADQPQTVEEYMDLFELIKTEDANGNGDKTDEIPFGVRERLGYSELFFGSYELNPDNYNLVDGELVPDVVNPDMKKVVDLWRRMYQNGYVNEDMFTRTGGDWAGDIRAGVIGVWTHDAQNLTTSWNVNRFADPDAEILPTPGPVRADGSGEYGLRPKFVSPSGWAVCGNGDRFVKLYDWSLSDDQAKNMFFTFGVEGVNYTMEDGEVQFDPDAPANSDLNTASYIQVMINPARDNRLSELLIQRLDNKATIYQAIEAAGKAPYPNPAGYMGTPETLQEYPELGGRDGTLFFDMFAKVITGEEPLDAAWDAYVAEWYRRGGQELVDEINEWYDDFYSN